MLERLRSLDHDGAISGPAEVRILALDGSISTVDVTSVRTTWQGRPAMQAIMRDLAAVKAARAALAYEAALVAHVSDAIIGLDKCGLVTSWNPAAESIYGWSSSETLGQPVLHFLQTLPPVGQSGQVHHQSRDGRTVVARASVSELRDPYDQVSGAVIICSDETARLRADQQYATVVANLQEGICVIGADGLVESANPAAERLLGVSRGQLDGFALAEVDMWDEHGTHVPLAVVPASQQRTGASRSRTGSSAC